MRLISMGTGPSVRRAARGGRDVRAGCAVCGRQAGSVRRGMRLVRRAPSTGVLPTGVIAVTTAARGIPVARGPRDASDV